MDSPLLTALLATLLVATMLSIGTRLTPAGFGRLARRPTALVTALAFNLLLIPGLAVTLVGWVSLPAAVGYGIVLAAAAPGGGTGVLLARHARGDLTLAVSLQGSLALLGLLAVPLWTLTVPHDTAGLREGAGPLLAMLLAGQLLPLAGGMLLRARWPARADRLGQLSGRLADLLLLTLTGYIVIAMGHQLSQLPPVALGVIVLLVLACLTAYATPALAGPAARRTVAMTATVRNLSLGLLVAGQTTEAGRVSLTLIAYSIVMYALAGLALLALRRAPAAALTGPTAGGGGAGRQRGRGRVAGAGKRR